MKNAVKRAVTISFSLLLFIAMMASLVPLRSKTLTDILLLPLEKRFETNIEFASSEIWLPARISLRELSVIEETGRLYHFDSIDVRYNIADLALKGEFLFIIKGVKLYQNMSLLDSITGMLKIPDIPDIQFDAVEGVFRLSKKGTAIRRFYAYNDKVRIRASGWADRAGSLDCDVRFSFSNYLTGKIPEVVRSTMLKDEKDGWMGITLKAKGNYKRPSLHLTGDSLKVNIKELF